jgi:hypothetical protein
LSSACFDETLAEKLTVIVDRQLDRVRRRRNVDRDRPYEALTRIESVPDAVTDRPSRSTPIAETATVALPGLAPVKVYCSTVEAPLTSENPEVLGAGPAVSDADESVRADGTIEWTVPATAVNLTETVAVAPTARLPEVVFEVNDICSRPPFFNGMPELKMR